MIALRGRDEVEVQRLFKILSKYMVYTEYCEVAVKVFDLLLGNAIPNLHMILTMLNIDLLVYIYICYNHT